VTATLLEWDDRIPSFDEVHDEALKANEFIDGAKDAENQKRGKRSGGGRPDRHAVEMPSATTAATG